MMIFGIFPRKWMVSTGVALALHCVIFFGSGMTFVQPAQYGVDASSGGIEVSLIAAMPATAEAAAPALEQGVESDAEAFEKAQEQAIKAKSAQKQREQKDYTYLNETPYAGDGSSAVPGQSHTTMYSPGGSTTDQIGYLSNPPPPYPAAAIAKGDEGLVLLNAVVGADGRPKSVKIKKSSGKRLLDESALKTVRRWKFNPGRVGMMAVETTVDIPVRFSLEEYKKSRGL